MRTSKHTSTTRRKLASVTGDAADAGRFPLAENPPHFVTTNGLIDTSVHETLENCAAVLRFLSDVHTRGVCSAEAAAGLVFFRTWSQTP